MLAYKKIISIFIIMIIIVCVIPFSHSYAKNFDDIVSSGQQFIKDGKNDKSTLNGESLKNLSGSIFNILLSVAVIVAVIIAAILGAQFIFGSVETQVKVKEALVPFVVGCVIVFGAFTIWKLVITLASNMEKDSTSQTSQIAITEEKEELDKALKSFLIQG